MRSRPRLFCRKVPRVKDTPKGTRSCWYASIELPKFRALRSAPHFDVCVVGAGIVGLTIAYLLASEGISLHLRDSTGRRRSSRRPTSGSAASRRYENFRKDRGPGPLAEDREKIPSDGLRDAAIRTLFNYHAMPVTLDWQHVTLRLILTVAAGLVIGINRGEHGRPAGMRTTLLVCLAAPIAFGESEPTPPQCESSVKQILGFVCRPGLDAIAAGDSVRHGIHRRRGDPAKG